MGGRPQAASLVQGLRPLQNHPSPTVCILRKVSAGEHGDCASCVAKSLNGSKNDWLVKRCGLVVTSNLLFDRAKLAILYFVKPDAGIN